MGKRGRADIALGAKGFSATETEICPGADSTRNHRTLAAKKKPGRQAPGQVWSWDMVLELRLLVDGVDERQVNDVVRVLDQVGGQRVMKKRLVVIEAEHDIGHPIRQLFQICF